MNNPWTLDGLVDIVNQYLDTSMTKDEFLQGQFTGSEIYEAIDSCRQNSLGMNPMIIKF